jgi:hypothetical protein
MHGWSTFGARTNHGQTQIHKIHHNPNLREAITFPLIVLSMLAMGLAPKCHFVLGLPSWSFEIPEIGTPTTLKAHNLFFGPPIEMKYETKLYFS